MRDDAPERFPLRAEEEDSGHQESEDSEYCERIPEAPPAWPDPSRGGNFDWAERSPGSLHGDERGGQRPKKP